VADVFLGVDVGTSGTKTLAIESSGKILATANAEYPVDYPKPGWSEQNPEDWWRASVATIQQVLRDGKIDPKSVKGVGLSGQMHGSVFLDAINQVVRPALLWNDNRTTDEINEIEERAGGRAELLRMAANPALTGFTAPKILWLRNKEPHRFKDVRTVLLPKDYVRFRLIGEHATEVSDASGTLLLDVANRTWSTELLGKLDLDPSLMPKCYESFEVSGTLTAEAAKATGLNAGTPVVGGGGDQAAGAVGNGIVRSGIISATLGTSGVVFAHSDQMQVDPHGRLHTFCHAVPGKWHQMGVMLSAGGSLQWYRNQFAQSEVAEAKRLGKDPYELLSAAAEAAPVGSEGLVFLPYLTGERTPHADPCARGAWIGLNPRHGKAHLIRSIMEGVSFGMRDSLELVKGLGVPIEQIRASGGGARSPFWRQIMADVFGAEVVTINAKEGPAFGVALLAAVGTGVFKSVEEACEKTIDEVDRTPSNPHAASVYDKTYGVFTSLYKCLKGDFKRLAELTNR
jgi:xylulokinase